MKLVPLAAAGNGDPTMAGRQTGGLLRPLAVAALVLVLAAALSVMVGKAPLPARLPWDLLAAKLGLAAGGAWPASAETILLDIRLPRIALAGLVGAALAIAGATYQGVFRNDLADPYVLGVASGAGLGAVVAFVLPLPPGAYRVGAVQLLAFLGALAAVAAVYAASSTGRGAPIATLLLAGVAVGAALNAVAAYLMYANGDQLLVIYSWFLGGFNIAGWREVALIAPAVAASAVAMALGGRTLNVLQFGDEQAATLGIRVARARLLLVVAATLAAAVAVSVAGLIGFVGLVVPHAARLLVSADHRRLLPVSALLGAAFLIGADALARGLPGPVEVPVGVVTAAIGGPFFLLLLRREKRRWAW